MARVGDVDTIVFHYSLLKPIVLSHLAILQPHFKGNRSLFETLVRFVGSAGRNVARPLGALCYRNIGEREAAASGSLQ